MGLSGHLHTLTTVCVNKWPLGHIQHEAGDSPEPVLLSTEQTYALSSTTIFVLLLQDILHTSQLLSTKYRVGVVLLKSVTYS